MPELPEVQALADALQASLAGTVIESVQMRSVSALKTFDPPLLALHGDSISACSRRGKFLVISTAQGLQLVVHLARSGWLHLRARPSQTRASLRGPLLMVVRLAGGAAVEATEQGTEHRFAVYLVRDVCDVPGIARLGVDAVSEELTVERLAALLAANTGTLKSVLADQAVIAGIGNAYSDEILHRARLSPFQKASALDTDGVQRLHGAMRDVLADAIQRAHDVQPDELRGDKKLRLNVHGRKSEPCPVCGDTVREVSFSSRSFQYCPTCQTGGRVYADRRLSKLLR